LVSRKSSYLVSLLTDPESMMLLRATGIFADRRSGMVDRAASPVPFSDVS